MNFLKLIVTVLAFVVLPVACAEHTATTNGGHPFELPGEAGIEGGVDGDGVNEPSLVEDTWVWHINGPRCRRYGNGLVELDDIGVVVAGYNSDGELGGSDGWLIRFDNHGSVLWETLIGGRGSEWAAAATLHPEGGIVVAGGSSSFSGGRGWLVHVDADGHPVWQRTAPTEGLNDVVATEDGGFLVIGQTDEDPPIPGRDVWVARVSSDGELEWQRRIRELDAENGSVAEAADGDVLVAARWVPNVAERIWLGRLRPTGVPIWQQELGIDNGSSGRLTVLETTDGDVALVATLTAGIVVLRFDAGGSLLWQRRIEASDATVRGGVALAGQDGGLLIGGTESGANGGVWNPLALGLDAAGDLTWRWSIVDEHLGEAHDAIFTRDGGAIIMAGGCADTWLLKIALNGTFHGTCDALDSPDVVAEAGDVSLEEVNYESLETSYELTPSNPRLHETTSTAEVLCLGTQE